MTQHLPQLPQPNQPTFGTWTSPSTTSFNKLHHHPHLQRLPHSQSHQTLHNQYRQHLDNAHLPGQEMFPDANHSTSLPNPWPPWAFHPPASNPFNTTYKYEQHQLWTRSTTPSYGHMRQALRGSSGRSYPLAKILSTTIAHVPASLLLAVRKTPSNPAQDCCTMGGTPAPMRSAELAWGVTNQCTKAGHGVSSMLRSW